MNGNVDITSKLQKEWVGSGALVGNGGGGQKGWGSIYLGGAP